MVIDTSHLQQSARWGYSVIGKLINIVVPNVMGLGGGGNGAIFFPADCSLSSQREGKGVCWESAGFNSDDQPKCITFPPNVRITKVRPHKKIKEKKKDEKIPNGGKLKQIKAQVYSSL